MQTKQGSADLPLPYVLGHTGPELERLKAQAAIIDPITHRFFKEAGLESRMRVLDIGTGAGDVAFLAADLVGRSGQVTGVDRSASALTIARQRAQERGLDMVRFVQGDAETLPVDERFDAVIGRYVLQFQRSPADFLRGLASHVRPGGLVVFHEIDWSGLHSVPPVPAFDQCWRWGEAAIRAGGAETQMGSKLHATFVGAGLATPTMRLEAPVGGAETMTSWMHMFVALLTTLLPAMQRAGIASEQELDLPTLADRLLSEVAAAGGVVIGHLQVAAWATIADTGSNPGSN
jgi:SAM-dependent methyltransferase